VPREDNPNSGCAGRIENLKDSVRDLPAILNLLHDSDLHVVHDKS
jgi:hypothetical protein